MRLVFISRNESYEVTIDDNDPSYNTIPTVYPASRIGKSMIGLKLRVFKATSPNELVGEQDIPYALYGTNSIQITDPDLLNAIKNQSLGDTFNYSIKANYTPDSFPTGDQVECETVTNETIKSLPHLYVSALTYPTTEGHSASETVSSMSEGLMFFESSDQSVLSIDGSGNIIPVGNGTTTIAITQASTSVFEAMTTQETVIVTPTTVTFVPLVLDLNNGVTIRYTGNLSNVPIGSPLFFQADIRGTGTPEWFAVVNQSSFQAIRNYANGTTGPFIPPGQTTPVPFNNIVTTLMTNMSGMFANATTFNQAIGSWDTSRVVDMFGMFQNAAAFNQPINSWNTSWVGNMASMFSWASAFIQPLNNWNVSNVFIMHMMFSNATNFNQNISGWNVSRIFTAFGFILNSALSSANTPNFRVTI